MDGILAVLAGIMLYVLVCVLIALFRMLFSKKGNGRKQFKDTFWAFFIEILDPFHWI